MLRNDTVAEHTRKMSSALLARNIRSRVCTDPVFVRNSRRIMKYTVNWMKCSKAFSLALRIAVNSL